MTAIYYPDCEATSDNGRYTLEARSPHNGTIPYRGGRLTWEKSGRKGELTTVDEVAPDWLDGDERTAEYLRI
jgi:hypothetical protein